MKLVRKDATANTNGRDEKIDINALLGIQPAPIAVIAKAQIDSRYSPPSAATVAQWLSWSAPTDNSDSDAGTLSDERGD